MTMTVIALMKRHRLKLARQDSTARIHRRINAWSAQSDIRVRKQRRNVRHGTFFFLLFSPSLLMPHTLKQQTLLLFFFLFLILFLSLLLLSPFQSQRQRKVELSNWWFMLRMLTRTFPRSKHQPQCLVQKLSSRIRQLLEWILAMLRSWRDKTL